jgi:hypothetical protein
MYQQRGQSVAVSPSGNIAVIGSYELTIDFGKGALNTKDYGAFLVELDRDGATMWSRALGALNSSYPPSVVFDGEEVVIAGTFAGDALDLGMGPLSSSGVEDLFLAAFDSHGAPLWAHTYGNEREQRANSLVVDPTGTLYLSGELAGEVNFGSGPIHGDALTSNDVFLAAFDPKGHAIAARAIPIDDGGLLIFQTVANPVGGVFLAGTLLGTADFGINTVTVDAYPLRMFGASFNTTLQPRYASLLTDSKYEQSLSSMTTDPAGNLIVLGGDEQAGTFLLGLDGHALPLFQTPLQKPFSYGSFLRPLSGSRFALVGPREGNFDYTGLTFMTFDTQGKMLSSRDLQSGSAEPLAAATAPGDAIVLTGKHGQNADLGFGPLANKGSLDVFVAQLPSN